MKKIFLFISPLIAFFLGGFILSFSCNAQAMPTPTPDTFNTIVSGNNSLSFSLFSNVDVLPINSNPVDLYRIIENVAKDPLVVGSQLNLMQNNDYTVSELTQREIDNFSEVYPYLYDVNGNTVSWDNVYHLHYMNAMFHGDVYIDGDGNILTSDQSNTKTMFQLGVGGYLLNVSDVANIYDLIEDELNEHQFNYFLDENNNTYGKYSLYLITGMITNYHSEADLRLARSIYIPNFYDTSICYCPSNKLITKSQLNQTFPSLIYFVDDPSQFITDVYFDNSSTYSDSDTYAYISQYGNVPKITRLSSPYTYNGKTYYYELYTYVSSNTFLSLSNFETYKHGPTNCFISCNSFSYDQTLYNNDIVSFKKIISLPSTKQLQFNELYDYNYINELEQSLNNTDSSPNELFDASQSIDETNYPLNIEVPSSAPDSSPSELPFPEADPEPEPTPMPDPETAPSIGSDIGEVDPTELRSTIPIINNLLNRFPFSIPWDIYGLLSGLSVQRETPYINTTIHIPGINYDWVLDYDLSDFDGIASLFRTLFLIAFILGLAYFSYDHFFGS